MEGPVIRVLSFRFNGDEQREKEFNEWYNTVHVPHVTQCPGWIAGYRYRDVDDPHSYISLYVFESKEALKVAQQALESFLDPAEIEELRGWMSDHLLDFTRRNYEQLYP